MRIEIIRKAGAVLYCGCINRTSLYTSSFTGSSVTRFYPSQQLHLQLTSKVATARDGREQLYTLQLVNCHLFCRLSFCGKCHFVRFAVVTPWQSSHIAITHCASLSR